MNHLHGASWIACGENADSPIVYKHFNCSQVCGAELFVTGLGYFEACLNGQPVSNDRFVPAFSDYGPRNLKRFAYPLNDHTTHRIYYCRYDVGHLLKDGENQLSIQLGNGFYRQKERICEGPVDFDTKLRCIFRLVLQTKDGSIEICSDGTETWSPSEIRYSNLFIGEVVDPVYARRYRFSAPVAKIDPPPAQLTLQTCPADRVMRTIPPRLIHQSGDRTVYDAGENISGVVRVHTSAPRGSRIVLRFAEHIREDHTLDFASTGGGYICGSGRRQIMEDVFITDGTERSFEPKFAWHAFRYFEVEGCIDSAEVLVIHSNTPVTSSFASSSEALNFLYDAFIRTQTNNMHGGVPSDCPHRERLGYTGDGQVCAPAAMLLLDSEAFYRKWIQDLLDCQDPKTGHVQHTAPLMGGGGGPGGWGCAIVLVPWAFYQRFGDLELLRRCFVPMQRWIDYLLSRCEDGLVVREEERGWCLGDWCTLENTEIPTAFVNTCYLLKCLEIVQEIASLLGVSDVPDYTSQARTIAASVRRHFEDDGRWCGSIQGAQAWALWAGLGTAETAEAMAQRYEALGCFDTGFLGTDVLVEMLLKYGYADTACKLLCSNLPGSFLYMKNHGATTIWERWTGEESHNHPMFGACVRQLFSAFLGIRPQEAGYGRVLIAPQVPQLLEWAEGSLMLGQSQLSVCWKQNAQEISFQIAIPQGLNAHFTFGAASRPLPPGEHTIVCRK